VVGAVYTLGDGRARIVDSVGLDLASVAEADPTD
jgi:hypothetical protein